MNYFYPSMKGLIVGLATVLGFASSSFAQSSLKNYIECNHDSLITVLRAYEDSLALSTSATVVRVDYAWRVTDVAVGGKVYKIYRCEALYDSLEVLMEEVAFARMTPPTVDTDSIGSITGTGATFYGKVTADGDTAVTAQWFKYGLSAGNLTDSLAVTGVATPFSAVASGLTAGSTYYVAAFAKNVKGTSPGDTLSFSTAGAPTVDTTPATAVDTTTATLNATFTDGGIAVSATGFKYASNSALTGASTATGNGTTSPFSAALTGLSASTQYWAVAFATNSLGTSYGDTVTFTTTGPPPPALTVNTNSASSVGHESAVLNASFINGSGVTATGFKYGTDAALTAPTDVAGSGLASPFKAALTGLSATTDYWAVGYATNGTGTVYGDTVSFRTIAPACTSNSVTYHGYTYPVVTVGTQCWFAENLQTNLYRNGAVIPMGLDSAAWSVDSLGAATVQGEGGSAAAANLAAYGRLYNHYAVMNSAGLCPAGWHVPQNPEWDTLLTFLGGSYVAGPALKASSTDSPSWNGTNSSGLDMVPAGNRWNTGFSELGTSAFFWVSALPAELGSFNTYWSFRRLPNLNSMVNQGSTDRRMGMSVRCVMDLAPSLAIQPVRGVTDTAASVVTRFTTYAGGLSAQGLKYATNAALTGATTVATNTDYDGSYGPKTFSGAITGLTPATQYWVVAYATNNVGTTYTDTVTFTTRPLLASACSAPSVTYDGFTYSTVSIGTQCWMKENLRTTVLRDATAIPNGLTSSAWTQTTALASTALDEGGANEAANISAYGRLYNWYAVDAAAGLCPAGWHVPTKAEFDTLIEFAGGVSLAGPALKAQATATPGWNGNDATRFSALPGGYRDSFIGNFMEGICSYWTSTPYYSTSGEAKAFAPSGVNGFQDSKTSGRSVRCIQDPLAAPTVDTDAASSLSETGATLNATITSAGGAAVTATGFKYAANAALSSPTDVAGSGTSGAFTASLTGLTASTQYWAVGYATNAGGTSYGDTITFTTSSPPFACGTSTVTYDGHAYTTVLIGSQCWFKENLRNDNYNDGTAIPGNLTDSQWTGTTSGAQTVYNNDPANLATYGRLYNWYAVTDAAGLCPTGWHVPTDAEWTALVTQLGGSSVAGTVMKSSSSDIPAWDGTNSSGFSALPGGFRNYGNGYFNDLGNYGGWWSSSPSGSYAWLRYLNSGYSDVNRHDDYVRFGYSVRCLKD